MLISLLAMIVMGLSAGIRAILADVPVVLEGPSTLELGLIGTGIFIVYVVSTRALGRRRARIADANMASQLAIAAENGTTIEEGAQPEPSRGAA